jgi:hypothetical protein
VQPAAELWAGWTLFGSLATYLVHAFISGKLISRRMHDERIKDYKAAVVALEATVRELKEHERIMLSRSDREPAG